MTNCSVETVLKEDKEDSKEFSLILTIAVDNREKRKVGNRYPLLRRGPVKFISENKQSTDRTDLHR